MGWLFWVYLPCPVSVCGLTQQRHDQENHPGGELLKVGLSAADPYARAVWRKGLCLAMMLIGIDPHKLTHTATAVAPETHRDRGSLRIGATLADYDRLLDWAAQWPRRRWAVENAAGMGHHLAAWLLARGEHVVDVPPRSTARVRHLSRGGRHKNDRIDAAAAACVAAATGDASPPLQPEGSAEALALLAERRTSLSQARVRAANQLHALLRTLLPGGAPRDLSAAKAEQLVDTVTPAGAAERTRHQLATDLIAEGKTTREARRCLKRRLADHVWRTMLADERQQLAAGASPRGHPGAALTSSAAGQTPTTSSSNQSLPKPAHHKTTSTPESTP